MTAGEELVVVLPDEPPDVHDPTVGRALLRLFRHLAAQDPVVGDGPMLERAGAPRAPYEVVAGGGRLRAVPAPAGPKPGAEPGATADGPTAGEDDLEAILRHVLARAG